MSKCCGMSLLMNFKTNIKNVLFPNAIEGGNFVLLTIAVFVVVLLTDYINLRLMDISRLNYAFVSTGLYFIGWALMMLSMSSNVYIILSILMAKFIGFYMSHKCRLVGGKTICCH